MTKFKLSSGNVTPFKQMGSSPAKQAIGGGPGEAVAHHQKYLKRKMRKKAIKTGAKKVLSRFIPYAGWALLASDVVGTVKKMKSGKTLKQSLKSQFLGIDEEKTKK